MKKKDLSKLKEKSIKDLRKMVEEKKKEAQETFAKIKGGQEKNVKKFKSLRKDIAQILTLIGEKQIVKKEKLKKEK